MDLTLSPGFNGMITMKFVFAEHNYVQLFNNDSHIRDGKNEGSKRVNYFRSKGRLWVYLQTFL
jgi:hypothetical protein